MLNVLFVVTMRQARLALYKNNLYESISLFIDNLGQEAKIEWEFATEVRRDSDLVKPVQSALNLSDDKVDELFNQASQIT